MHSSSVKKIFARGLALAIPLGVILFVFIKLIANLAKVIHPVATKLGIEKVLGELTLTILTVLVLIIFVFLLGLLMQLSIVAMFGKTLEDVAIKFIPSLQRFKRMAGEKLDVEDASDTWKPVMVRQGKKYFPAFIIEESPELITLFTIKGTSLDKGDLLITAKSEVELEKITAKQISQFSKQYGKGYIPFVQNSFSGKNNVS